MRLAPLLLVAAAALALAAPAAAKEMTKAELCGPAGCAAVTDKDDLRTFGGGETLGARPPMLPFYKLALSARGDGATETWWIYYVPAANMIAVEDAYGLINWHPLRASATAVLKRLAAQVDPFPTPAITSVAVGDRLVREGAASYLRLFDATGGTSPHNVSPDDWVGIDLRADRPSPWTDSTRELLYSPTTNVLERRTERLVLAEGIAADIEAARPLGAENADRWLPWLVLGGLIAALLVLAGVGALLRRHLEPAVPEPAA